MTNAAANVAELATISTVALFVWNHPYLTLSTAILLLILLVLLVRRIVKTIRKLFRGEWKQSAAG